MARNGLLRLRNRLGRTQEYLKQIVYGGNDGIVTTFAIVAGFAGASAEGTAQIGALAVLVFGLANLFADGVSMGLGEFLSTRSQRDLYTSQHAGQMRAISADPEAERAQITRILVSRGARGADAEDLARLLARNPELMADLIMTYEFEMPDPRAEQPAAKGLMTFLSFLVFGVIPLVPYFLLPPTNGTFNLSVAATLSALVALGLLRWNATGDAPLRAVCETVAVGGICAAVAYAVGMIVGAAG